MQQTDTPMEQPHAQDEQQAPPRNARPLFGIPWGRQLRAFAIVFSLFIHTAIVLFSAIVIVDEPVADAGEGEEISLAVMSESELSEMSEAELSEDSEVIDETTLEESVTVDDVPMMNDEVVLGDAEAQQVSDPIGAGSVSQSSGGLDIGSGGGSASFFGVEASGSRFAYIVDISGSMSESDRIGQLQRALISSIQELLSHTYFAIFPYSNETFALTGEQWRPAREKAKNQYRGYIETLEASGGTNPLPAFHEVFDLSPRPDAIYFMTDGIFDPGRSTADEALTNEEHRIAREIRRLNSGGHEPAAIHCITFGTNKAQKVMKKIARESNGGKYTHVSSSSGGQTP